MTSARTGATGRIAGSLLAGGLATLLIAAAAPAAGMTSRTQSARAARAWISCAAHPHHVRHLQARGLSCRRAARALRRGRFALVPAGPQFSTAGYSCRSPIGPPMHGPRFTVCRRGRHALRFYGFAEPSS